MNFTLTNYWWLLIWLFTAGIFFYTYLPKHTEIVMGRKVRRCSWGTTILMFLPYILWTASRTDQIGDTAAYRTAFKEATSVFSQIGSYLSTITKDKGFYLLVSIIKCIVGNSEFVFFLIIAAFQILVLAWLYRKYSSNLWLSLFLFIASTDYISWTNNGIRQFMAVTIILLATPFFIQRRYLPAILIVLLASTMHQSALLMLVLVIISQGKPWNRKTMMFLLAALIAIAFVGKFTHLLDNAMQDTQYSNVVSDWTEWNDDGTNPIRVLVYSIPTILSFFGLKYIREANDPVINFCTNMSICATGIYLVSMVTSGVFIGRLPIYASLYGYILLPWEIENIFARDSKKMIYLVAILCYLVFFYYQMHMSYGIL